VLGSDDAWREQIHSAVDGGVRTFLAAGGDGTVSTLANALLDRARPAPTPLVLGALGLGSSNDFHKPVTRRVRGVPLRLDAEGAQTFHPVRVCMVGADSTERTRYSMVSASIGVTARGNAAFDRGGVLLDMLKRRWVGAAVIVSALTAIARHANVPCRLWADATELAGPFANASFSRTPHVAGGLAFDTPVDPTGARLSLNVCGRMGHLELLAALFDMARGRLSRRPKTAHVWARTISLASGAPFDLEIDGEVFSVLRADLGVAPQELALCVA
jgi:diacylglycerol kinase family enzyme